MQTFNNFLAESKSQKETVGSATIEKVKNGILISTPSLTGNNKQVIAFTDAQITELIEKLEKFK